MTPKILQKTRAYTGVRVRHKFNLGVGVFSGIVAGILFLALEMILVPLFMDNGSPWGPPGMIAAMVLGSDILPPAGTTPTFHFTHLLVGLAVHLGLSVLFALVLAAFIYRLNALAALVVGALFGLALYAINFYGFTAIFPWFADARNWISIVSHIVFGVVAALVYKGLARPEVKMF